MEYIRDIKIVIEVDTNKSTDTENYENYLDAARELLSRLSDGERMELFGDFCLYCGCNDPKCQCWNDE
jgi:hypothetical protein